MKKRIISLMLAGAMLTGVGTMSAGCAEEETPDGVIIPNGKDYSRELGKNLIVALREKVVTLHKADVYTLVQTNGGYKGWATLNEIDTACGKGKIYTSDLIIYTEMPDESAYDVLCEKCFGNTN